MWEDQEEGEEMQKKIKELLCQKEKLGLGIQDRQNREIEKLQNLLSILDISRTRIKQFQSITKIPLCSLFIPVIITTNIESFLIC